MKNRNTEVKLSVLPSNDHLDTEQNADKKFSSNEVKTAAKLNLAKTLILKNCLTTTNV